MYRGIIYKYTSPSGKHYIGQTIDEKSRRSKFLNPNIDYSGPKINRARHKYGPENFEYEVIFAVESLIRSEVLEILDDKEVQYIKLFDSFENGYNSNLGGEGGTHIVTEDTRKKLSESTTNYYKTHDSVKNIAILQYSLEGDYIQEWDSISDAAKELGYSLGNFSTYCNGRNNHEYKGFLYYRGSESPINY